MLKKTLRLSVLVGVFTLAACTSAPQKEFGACYQDVQSTVTSVFQFWKPVPQKNTFAGISAHATNASSQLNNGIITLLNCKDRTFKMQVYEMRDSQQASKFKEAQSHIERGAFSSFADFNRFVERQGLTPDSSAADFSYHAGQSLQCVCDAIYPGLAK